MAKKGGEIHREQIPLVMLPGNIKVLLENTVPVTGISFRFDHEYKGAVVLVVTGLDPKDAKRLGFKTTHEGMILE